MKTLLANIAAIEMSAADWHYAAKGPAFYAEHLLADKAKDGLSAIADTIRETYYLGERQAIPPLAADTYAEAVALVTAHTGEPPAVAVHSLLTLCAAHCEDVARSASVSIGTKSLLDNLSQKCYQSAGLIWRTIVALNAAEGLAKSAY